MRPSRLGDGLGAALEGLRESSPMPFGLAVADLPPLDETRAMTGYLVVTEALANSFKHARSTRVDVRVSAEGERLVLEISDDGLIGQVLYLSAEAEGYRGTGIGCYFDDAVHEFLGLADQRLQVLYHFTVGMPLSDTRISLEPPYADRSPITAPHDALAP